MEKNYSIRLLSPIIKASGGGIVKWELLKLQIELTLRNNPKSLVTTMIDFYGLYHKLGFPRWSEMYCIDDKSKRVSFLEDAMRDDIWKGHRQRFIPYIQLHEFEGLLFSDSSVFYNHIPSHYLVGGKELRHTIEHYPNPEMINTSVENSPSHRLKRIIRGYNKITYGIFIAKSIGIDTIRKKCPRFNSWVERMVQLSEFEL